MDIGLLYQEYQRFAMTQNSVSQQQRQRQRQQTQQGSSTGEDILLKGIRQAMPSLLAPCSPSSSRLSASLPLSASSGEGEEEEEEEEEEEKEILPQPQPKKRRPQAAPACRATLPEQLPPSVAFESASAAATSTRHHHHAAATSPTIANEQQKQRPFNRPTAIADASCKTGKNDPLLVINPRDVKSVLTQVVNATMRDLLGKDQEAREKSLLRQIKRTLGEFEASMSAIVNNFAASRCQVRSINQRTVRNNSAGGPVSLGLSAGVEAASGSCSKEDAEEVAGMGAGATSSRDSGHTIRDSCCQSDECGTGSTRVGVRESDSICGDMLPVRYRPLSSLGCPTCTTVGVGLSHRNRRQKNFNHTGRLGSCGSSVGSEFCFSDWEKTPGQSGEAKKFRGILPPARDTATAYTDRTSRLPFPRFASDTRDPPKQAAPPTSQQRHCCSRQSAYFFCTDEEEEEDEEETADEDFLP